MRADKFLSEKYGSRTKAAQAVKRGEVYVNGKEISDPSFDVSQEDELTFAEREESFVSNGGAKLSRALKTFLVDIAGRTFVDVGASTGGFTDCLLQNGAKRVYAVDVGESQLDPSLKSDPRVKVMADTNARYLTAEDFPEEIDGATVDVSFISLSLILPAISHVVKDGASVFALIKPQFECENKKFLSKKGILLDKKIRRAVVEKIYDVAVQNGLYPIDIVNAPLYKGKNVEYVILLEKGAKLYADKKTVAEKADRLV